MPKLRACDACFHRKIQCTVSEPGMPCNWCKHQSLTCEFTRKQRAKPPKRGNCDEKELLLDRIKELEANLAQTYTPSPLAIELPTYAGSCDNYVAFATRTLQLNWYHRGTRVFSDDGLRWIAAQTGQNVDNLGTWLFDATHPRSCRSSSLPTSLSSQTMLSLPSRESTVQVFGDFPKALYQFVLPFLDTDSIASIIETAYGSSDTAQSLGARQSARACLFAAFTLMAHLETSTYLNTVALDSQACAAMSQSLLSTGNCSVTFGSLHAVLLLQKYRTITGQHYDTEMLHSVACRMICELESHTNHMLWSRPLDEPRQQQQHHHARRLFWLCYIMDKELSLLSGKPPVLVSDYCDMSAPEAHMVADQLWPEPHAMFQSLSVPKLVELYSGDAHLSLLKEKIFRMLYAPSALGLPDHDLLARIRLLDDELESWRMTVPPELRPNLSSSRAPCAKFLTFLRSIQLQLDYHYTITCIHTTVRRLGAATHRDHLPEDLHSVMHSSMDLSLEASRSTLQMLSEPLPILQHNILWHTSFYPLMASVSLFVNILLHPLEEQADKDTESLNLAVRIVGEMCSGDKTQGGNQRTYQARDFIAELLRLAKCAISKAEKEPQL